MKYKDMSVFEINKMVSIEVIKENKRLSIKSIEYDDNQNVIWVETCGYSSYPIKDYCNSPADIMPIAIEYKIGVEFIDGYGWTASSAYGGDDLVFSCYDNPYIAIAICFLMMKDAEK